MKALAAVTMLLAIAAPSWWVETNSHAASARARRAYDRQQYADALEAYRRAQELDPTARGAFNLGTASIAAGKLEQGAAALEDAARDPLLRADALYNRGNSALAAKAFDAAVRDYIEALRANPAHQAAKRNLEIALARRESQRQQQSGGQRNQQGPPQNQQQQPQPQPGDQEGESGQIDLEALLRSVQQQESEELRRMKGSPLEGRVGW